jgi:hypothetical protein
MCGHTNFQYGVFVFAQIIESVLNNLAPGDQFFVIDGGCTDGSTISRKSVSL